MVGFDTLSSSSPAPEGGGEGDEPFAPLLALPLGPVEGAAAALRLEDVGESASEGDWEDLRLVDARDWAEVEVGGGLVVSSVASESEAVVEPWPCRRCCWSADAWAVAVRREDMGVRSGSEAAEEAAEVERGAGDALSEAVMPATEEGK